MKRFFATNWYKLMIGSSLLMASFGFMIHSIASVTAKPTGVKKLSGKALSNKVGKRPSFDKVSPSDTYYVIDSYNQVWWFQDGNEDWTLWTTLEGEGDLAQ